MGCLFKRGKTWYAKWVDHTGKTVKRTTGTPDKASASRILSKWEKESNDIRVGLVDPAQLALAEHRRRPISEHLEAWYSDHGLHIQPNTLREYKRHLGRFLDAFGGGEKATVAAIGPAETLADCTADRMRAFMRWRVTDCARSNADANRAFQAVRAFMQWCDNTRRLERNPLKGVKKLDETRRSNRRRIRREYTHEELEMLFRVARRVDEQWTRPADGRAHETPPNRYAQYMLCYYAALRRGDLEKITWDCIKFDKPGEGGTIRMERKNGKMTTLPIVNKLEPVLRAMLPSMVLPAALAGVRLFPRVVSIEELRRDLRRGQAWYIREGRTKEQRRERRRAGFLEDNAYGVLDLHSLRHARGTHLAMSSVPPKVLQELMDHADIRTTMQFYVHARAGTMAEQLNATDAASGGA